MEVKFIDHHITYCESDPETECKYYITVDEETKVAEVAFRLPIHDWYELAMSPVWKSVEVYLHQSQTEDMPMRIPDPVEAGEMRLTGQNLTRISRLKLFERLRIAWSVAVGKEGILLFH